MHKVARVLFSVLCLAGASTAFSGPQTYYLLAPESFTGDIKVVSLEPANTITVGNYQLTLDQYQRASIPNSVLYSGVAISGTKSFTLGSDPDATDLLVPTQFAGTSFAVPHVAGQHRYYLMTTEPGGATAALTVGASTTNVTLTANTVVEVDGGSNNALAARITASANIYVAHVGVLSGTVRDAFPVPPAASTVVGIRSQNVTLAASANSTSVTVYASDGTSSAYSLNAGEQVVVTTGANTAQGQGSALRIDANNPVMAVQHDDGDGNDATAFWPASLHTRRFAIPVDAQYVAVACTSASVSVTLYRGATAPDAQTCSGSATNPGKVFFGSATNGANIPAGWYVIASGDVYVTYEAATPNDEHNLLGITLPAGPAAPALTAPAASTTSNPLAISGTAAANAPIRIFVNNRLVATGTASAAGTFSINTPLVDGANVIYATALSGSDESAPSTAVSTAYTNGIARTQSGTISVNTVWTPGNPAAPYVISANLTVAAGAELTLQPGTTLKMANGVILATNGTLRIEGEPGNPVTITCNAATCTKGIWNGIDALSATSIVSVNYATIEWASTGIEINGGIGSVRNSTIRNFSTNGVWVQNVSASTVIANNLIDNINDTVDCIEASSGSPTITGNTLQNCAIGVNVFRNSSPQISGNTVVSNNYGIYVEGDLVQNPQPVVTGNQIFNNTTNFHAFRYLNATGIILNATGNWWGSTDLTAIANKIADLNDNYTNQTNYPAVNFASPLNAANGAPIAGNYLAGAFPAASTTLTAGATYQVIGTVFVSTGKALTIPGGTTLRFHGTGAHLVVDGTLNVQGTAGNLAQFTSGRATQARGDWPGIRLRANGSLVEYAQIDYAATGVIATNFAVTVRNSTIRNFSSSGIYVEGAVSNASLIQGNLVDNLNDTAICLSVYNSSPSIIGNTLQNCSYGMNLERSSATVNGNNIITANNTGIYIDGGVAVNPLPVFNGNQIFANDNTNLTATRYANATGVILNATGNWWGSADLATIASKITDFSDNYTNPTTYPTVNFANPLDGPNGNPITGNYLVGPLAAASTTLTTGTTYQVIGTVLVPATRSLTIPGGATLRFSVAGSQIVVDGVLTVQGTNGNPAILTSGRATQARGDWYGIRVRANGSLIEYAQIDYATTGVNATNFAVTVRNSTIRNFSSSGVYVEGAASNASLIQGNLVDNLNDTAICLSVYNSSPSIIGNTLQNCSYGMNLERSSATVNGNNIITANNTGIYIDGGVAVNPLPVFNGNQIFANDNTNLTATRYGNAVGVIVNATGNWWGTTDLTAIASKISDVTDTYTNQTTYPTVNFANPLDGPTGLPISANYLVGPLSAVSTTLTAGTTYQVIGVLFVPATRSLTIPGGATLRFHGNAQLVVDGTLMVQGVIGTPAVFTSGRATQTRGDWPGIRLRANGSLLEHAQIDYAATGVIATNFAVTVRNSTIRNFSSAGIYVEGAVSNASLIQGNLVDNLNDTAICLSVYNSSPSIIGNTLQNCSYGMNLERSSATVNGNNIITANNTGIYIDGGVAVNPLPVFNGNQIFGNDNTNLTATRYGNAVGVIVNATGNWWGTTDLTAIASKITDLNDNYTNQSTYPTVNFANPLDGPSGNPVAGNYLAGPFAAAAASLTAGTSYDVIGALFVSATKSLTIPAGATLRFHGGAQIVVDGTLQVQGTVGSPVVMTSGRATQARGDWAGIRIRANGSLIEYAQIDYAATGVNATGFAVTVRNSTIRSFSTYGLYIDGAAASPSVAQGNVIDNLNDTGTCINVLNSAPSIIGNTLQNCSYGIYLERASNATINGNNIITSNVRGITLDGGVAQNPLPLINGNQIFGNNVDNLQAYRYGNSTNLVVDATGNWWGTTDLTQVADSISDWADTPGTPTNYPTVNFANILDGPAGSVLSAHYLVGSLAATTTTLIAGQTYQVIGILTVPAAKTLTVPAGTVLKFHGDGARVTVDGTLQVQGTNVSPVLFISGSSAPARGDWTGIVVRAGATGIVLDHATIEHAVRGIEIVSAAAVIRNARIYRYSSAGISMTTPLAGTEVRDSLIDNFSEANGIESYGIYINAGSPLITGNRIQGSRYGIFVIGGSNPTITANVIRNNLWGVYLQGNGANTAPGNPNPVLTGNDFIGNSSAALQIYNYGASNPIVINATGNYWGVATPVVGTQIKFQNAPASIVNFAGYLSSPINGTNASSLAVSDFFFSPNADTVQETTAVTSTLSQSGSWTLNVRASSGALVRTYTGTGTAVSATWDGKNGSSQVVSDGLYLFELTTSAAPSLTLAASSTTVDNTPPQAVMTAPTGGAVLSNITSVAVLGSATDIHFQDYLLEHGAGTTPTSWTSFKTSTNPVQATSLGSLTVLTPDGSVGIVGPNAVRVRVTDTAGNVSTSSVAFTIDNVAAGAVAQNLQQIRPTLGEQLTVNFNLSGAATVYLRIYPDLGGSMLREISQVFTTGGAKSLSWDGRDASNNLVPDEAYRYVLQLVEGSRVTTYDPPDVDSVGSNSGSVDATFNAHANDFFKMNLTVSDAKARIRMQVTGCTPTTHYPYNWVPVAGGTFPIMWNGRDANGAIVSGACSIYFDPPDPLRPFSVIVKGTVPAITGTRASPNLEVDGQPYVAFHSYDQIGRFTYRLSLDSIVTVKLLPPGVTDFNDPSAVVVTNAATQPALSGGLPVDYAFEWKGHDGIDTNNILVSAEGSYTVAIQATSTLTGRTTLYRGVLQLYQ